MGFHLLPALLLKCKTHIMVESVSCIHNLKIHHYHPHKSKHIPLQNENFLSLSPFFRTLTIKYFNESESEVTQWCLTLQPCGLSRARLLHPWYFLGKSTGVDCHFLLQWIFPTQGSNPGLPHCRQILYHLSQEGSSVLILCPNYKCFNIKMF